MSTDKGVRAFRKDFEMDISIKSGGYLPPQAPPRATVEAVQHREVIEAARSINASGYLGQNQIVFVMERGTHRAIMRVVDRETNEVLLQLPPEYVLRLAQELNAGSALTNTHSADE
ncbi:MAG TPA: flagellar protein FlaG [Bryobacteraceae bacterium]